MGRVAHGGLEERAVELEQRVALGGDPLGKETHAIAARERGVNPLRGARGVAPLVAAHEERARFLGDPSGDRPIADLALGDETRRAGARDDEYVEPRDVVCGDHGGAIAFMGNAPFDLCAYVEDAQQLRRPPLHDHAPSRCAHARIGEAQEHRRHRGVPRHSRPAQDPDRTDRVVNA